MPRSPLRRVAATCAVLLGGLAFTAAAHADTPCPDGARCGKLTVPLDRANPSTGTIDIAYALVPRTDTSRPALGTILPNPGGPGSGAIADAARYEKLFAPLRKRRDLLLIDPRGTGESGALACPSLATKDPLTLDLAGLVTACGADLGARAGFYGAAAVADDFEAVRVALGVEKLDLWAESYGTFLMPVYAARHPDHVRSMVLSGAYPISFDPWGRDLVRGVRRAIDLVCRRTDSCSGPRVLDDLGRLARRLRRHPVTFTAPTADGPVPTHARGARVGHGHLRTRRPVRLRPAARRGRCRAGPRLRAAEASGGQGAPLPGRDRHAGPVDRQLRRARRDHVPRLPPAVRPRRSARGAAGRLRPCARGDRPGRLPPVLRRRMVPVRDLGRTRVPRLAGRPRPPDRPCRATRSPTSPSSYSPATSTRTRRSSRAARPRRSSRTRRSPSSPTPGTRPTCSRAARRWGSTSSCTCEPIRTAAVTPANRRPWPTAPPAARRICPRSRSTHPGR